MHFRDVFLNSYGRLRSGWRFTLFVVCFVFVASFVSIGVGVVVFSLTGVPQADSLSAILANSFGLLVTALGLGWLFGRLLEGLPFRALGASLSGRWFFNLIVGLAVGATALLIAVGISAAAGGISFSSDGLDTATVLISLLRSALVFAVAAAFEEALFRGYIFQTFTRAQIAWVAILITSCTFGIVHWRNPNADLISTLNTMLAGVWLGIAYLKTRDLWFPFGVHFAWNWLQGSVFGIEVSGMTSIVSAPLFKEIDRGPTWLTGGDYGLEAGIACTVALIVTTVLIYFLPGSKPNADLFALTGMESEISRI